MVNTLKAFALMISMSLGLMLMMPAGAQAVSAIADQCAGNTESSICKDQNAKPADFAKNIINILLYIVGAISVLAIIIGGITYTTSAGAAAQITKAKNMILYAVIGLVLSLAALAIVQFVVGRFI
jgi:hypothetical protein